jgi:hypothetical protein
MIINKSIEIKISKKNIDHFLCYHKDIKLRDIIQVDPNNLQKSSNVKVDVSCDVCGIERTIKYQAYIKNINSCEEYPIYTCDKCSHVKIKSFNQKKYGVDYFSQTDEYNDKFKSTMMERYGVEYTLQSEELRDKVKKTNLEKFGFENPFMDGDRIRKIFNDKYGVDHPSKLLDDCGESKFFTNCWTPRSKKSEWNLYKSTVRNQTKQNIKLLDWDGTDFYDGTYIMDNFTLHHFDNDYPTIDHKISIYDGFLNNISTHIISSVDNICWTKRIINITKNKKSHY